MNGHLPNLSPPQEAYHPQTEDEKQPLEHAPLRVPSKKIFSTIACIITFKPSTASKKRNGDKGSPCLKPLF